MTVITSNCSVAPSARVSASLPSILTKAPLLFLSSCLIAQPYLVGQSPRTASIEGVVTEGGTRLAIKGVMVTLSGPGGQLSATTDDSGHYRFEHVPAGNTTVYAEPTDGFLPHYRRLILGPGTAVTNVDLELFRAALVTGRVVDSNSKPVAGVRVSVRATGYRNGRISLTSFHSGMTDNRGYYRVSGLRPGRYHVEAEVPSKSFTLVGTSSGSVVPREEVSGRSFASIRTYYINSPSLEGAALISLRPGQQRENVDIVLLDRETACVTAPVATPPDASPGTSVALILLEIGPLSQSRLAFGSFHAGGRYEVCGIAAGSYRLGVEMVQEHAFVGYATIAFDLTNKDVTLPELTPAPPEEIRGVVKLSEAGDNDTVPSGITLNLEPKDRIAMFDEAPESRVDTSGHFIIKNVFSDQYWLNVHGLPSGYYLKEADIGGVDLLRNPLYPSQSPVELTLGLDGPILSGTVLDSGGKPVSDATVVVMAEDVGQSSFAPNHLLTTVTNQAGTFVAAGMPPGNYHVFAVETVEEGALTVGSLLGKNDSSIVTVSLDSRARRSIKLTISPALQ